MFRTRLHCTSVAFVSAQALASVPRSQHAFSPLTGECSFLPAEPSPSLLTRLPRIRYLIWIGEFVLSVPLATSLIGHVYPGSDQEKTFGPTISGLIHRHIEPERLLLWDSKVRGGRPDTTKILKEVYESWQAEGMSDLNVCSSNLLTLYSVVFITSNYIGNSEMMQVCYSGWSTRRTAADNCRHRSGMQGGRNPLLRYIVGLLGVHAADGTSRCRREFLNFICSTVIASSIITQSVSEHCLQSTHPSVSSLSSTRLRRDANACIYLLLT